MRPRYVQQEQSKTYLLKATNRTDINDIRPKCAFRNKLIRMRSPQFAML